MVFVGAGTGQVARVPDDQPYFLGPNIGMIRIESEKVLPAYLELYLRSPVGNQLALGFAKAVAQPSLSMGSIRMIPVPVPPIYEQAQIVERLEVLLSSIEALGGSESDNLRRADRLRQSILKQAFSGQLVPQDPNDEPAGVLLERIRWGDVGAQHAAPRTRNKRQKRAQHAVPLREQKPATFDYPSLDSVLAAIFNHMQPGKEYSRSEIAAPLGLTTGRWNAAIQELKRTGKVRQEGERRGARYSLARD